MRTGLVQRSRARRPRRAPAAATQPLTHESETVANATLRPAGDSLDRWATANLAIYYGVCHTVAGRAGRPPRGEVTATAAYGLTTTTMLRVMTRPPHPLVPFSLTVKRYRPGLRYVTL